MLIAAAFTFSPAWGQSNNVCDEPGETPDLIVGGITGVLRYGTVNGITSYSFGTTSCNVGTCWLNWTWYTNQHPVIAQNMFRLKNGRFEQIGQAWLKHGFEALQLNFCSTSCMPSGTGERLGVNCSDPYDSGLNGTQSLMGPKYQVNGYTGNYPYPPANLNTTGDAIYKRLQVHNVDLDPALNSGAGYFLEGQYVTADDATSGNGGNNASYRPITVSGSGSTFNVAFAGPTLRSEPAIRAWKAADPTVVETQVTSEGDGRFNISAQATDLGDGYWHYEYAVHNLDSQRAGGRFSVPLPVGALVRNLGFHDVDYHSGELIDGEDWPATVETSPPAVTWITQAFVANAAGNAIRWGTLYNFRFDATAPPNTGALSLGLWRPGSPSSISVTTLVPQVCDNDGICAPSETCLRCPQDCGAQAPAEAACGNLQDDDCDGATDCADADCCGEGACLALFDADSDAHAAACDCNDADAEAWATPGESLDLTISKGPGGEARLGWSPPGNPGGMSVAYDTLRSAASSNFDSAAVCVVPVDPAQPINMDAEDPAAVFYYLVRAHNGCPSGSGTLGTGSSGQPRVGRTCP